MFTKEVFLSEVTYNRQVKLILQQPAVATYLCQVCNGFIFAKIT